MDYILGLAILICIYTLLAQSLNLLVGSAGLISVAHAGFFGIGAYATAWLTLHAGISFWISLPLAMLLSGTIALLASIVASRTVEDHFILFTLGLQIVIYTVLKNWTSLTGGTSGILNIPAVQLGNINFGNKLNYLLLCICFTLVVWLCIKKILTSNFGKVLIAISEDEIYAKSIGKNVLCSKTIAFTLSAAFAAIPGVLYAHYNAYLDQDSFTIADSILILSIVIIGGAGNLSGSFLASIIMVLIPEVIRFLGLPGTIAANIQQMIYGIILIILMRKGTYKMGKLFRSKKTRSV